MHGTEEMTQSVQFLPRKHNGLSPELQQQHKNKNQQIQSHISVTAILGWGGDKWILRAHCAASLSQLMIPTGLQAQ